MLSGIFSVNASSFGECLSTDCSILCQNDMFIYDGVAIYHTIGVIENRMTGGWG